MRWDTFGLTAIVIIFIVTVQWPLIKKASTREKAVFASILFIGWALTLLDLMETPGLNSILEMIFHPVARIIGL